MKRADNAFVPGLTPRSLAASLACMLLAGIYTQVTEVLLAAGAPAEQALPLPAMAVLLLLVLLSGGLWRLAKAELLTRAEMVCVLYAMLLSVPMMTQGMWHRFVGLIAAPPRSGAFEYMDAYPDPLWPHGANVLEDRLTEAGITPHGAPPVWERSANGRVQAMLSNTDDSGDSRFSIGLDLSETPGLRPGNPHLFSVLARTEDTGPESFLYCRVYEDGSPRYQEWIRQASSQKPGFLHPDGFERLGVYGVSLSPATRSSLRFEFGLAGRGRVWFADPKFSDVSTLEGVFQGRTRLRASEFAALPEHERDSGIAVVPDRLLGPAGIAHVVSGYIPLRDWVVPAAAWGSFILLLLAATFAVGALLRKQWAESERYPFPLARIPLAMIGADGGDGGPGGFAPVWRNRHLWAGFFLAMAWGGLKAWAFYNSSVPDTSIHVPLGPYFADGGKGFAAMGDTTFSVSIFLVSIAIFFELNVLISLVAGFWLFRALHWLGDITHWNSALGYPFRYEQGVGAYLGYFLAIVFFTRKYLRQVGRQAWRGERGDPGEALSPRTALLVLPACFAGVAAWSLWLGASPAAMLLFFAFLLSIGTVSAKLRAECGLPAGYFTPYNAMILVGALGGMSTFGATGMLVSLLLSGFLTVSVFFFIPGAQLELIQAGYRLRIRPRHLVLASLLGLFGGLFIGGWVFLSNSYALGGESIRYQWAYNQEWFFGAYKSALAEANTLAQSAGAPARGGAHWPTITMLLSGGLTVAISVLRQIFPGFWFHPIGFMLGSSHMMEFCWGSVLAAWAIRGLVLKFAGASGVRSRLQPFFVGALAGSVVIATLLYFVGAAALSGGATALYTELP